MNRKILAMILACIPALDAGAQISISGDVDPSPAISPVWTVNGTLTIGNTSGGNLTVGTGGFVVSTAGVLGGQPGGAGFVSINGTWISAGELRVGDLGEATLTVSGGNLSGTNGILASGLDSTGHATLSNGSWDNLGLFIVGDAGNGVYNQTGGALTAVTSEIGRSSTGVGVATISGGSWTTSGSLTVGGSGTGSLSVTGGTASSASVTVGSSANGTLNLLGGTVSTGQISEGAGSGAVIFNGGTLRLTGNQSALFTDFEAGDVTITGSGGTLDTQSFQVASSLGLTGNGALTKSGSGTLTFTGNNTYTGGTTISAGTLQIGDGGTTGSISGNITNNAALAFNRSNNATYSEVISGTGNLIKQGAGVLTLSGSNSYNGTTTIAGGVLAVPTIANGGSNSSIGRSSNAAANLILDGGTLRYTGASATSNRGFTLGPGGGTIDIPNLNAFLQLSGTIATTGSGARTLTLTGGTQSTGRLFGNVLSDGTGGATSLTKTGVGTWELYPTTVWTYSGPTTVSGGTLVFIGSGAPPGITSAVTVASGATLIARSQQANGNFVIGSIAGAGTVRGNAFGSTLNLTVGTNDSSTIFSGAIQDNSDILNPNDRMRLIKAGNGTLTLTGNNTYTQGTTISAGTLQIGNNGTTGSITGNVTNNATLTFNRSNNLTFSGVISGSGVVNKLAAGTLTLTANNTYTGLTTIGAGTLQLGNNGTSGSISGNITNNATLTFNRSNNLTHSGVISGTGVVNKLAAGTLTLTANNTYTGLTTISAGTLQLGNNGTSGSITGNITNNASLTFNRSDDITYGGVIWGNGSVTKLGVGTLALTGNSSYTGDTIVNSGTLVVNGSLTGSNVRVATGATLGGNGLVRQITLEGGGTVRPGNSIGAMLADSMIWDAGASMIYDLGSATSDRIALNGAFTKVATGSYLFTFLDLGWQVGQTYTLVEFGTTNFHSTDFGFTNSGGFGGTFNIASDKLTFTLTAIPEPSALTLLGLAAWVLARRRSRRSRAGF